NAELADEEWEDDEFWGFVGAARGLSYLDTALLMLFGYALSHAIGHVGGYTAARAELSHAHRKVKDFEKFMKSHPQDVERVRASFEKAKLELFKLEKLMNFVEAYRAPRHRYMSLEKWIAGPGKSFVQSPRGKAWLRGY